MNIKQKLQELKNKLENSENNGVMNTRIVDTMLL